LVRSDRKFMSERAFMVTYIEEYVATGSTPASHLAGHARGEHLAIGGVGSRAGPPGRRDDGACCSAVPSTKT
jgi:hypothetical protein